MENIMEVDKAIYNYYKSEVGNIKTPPPVIPAKVYKLNHNRIYNLVFEAAIVLVCIPVFTNISTPSLLSQKASLFSEYHNLESVIPAGLLEINKFVSKSLISGGK